MPRETIGLPPDERLAEMVKQSTYVQGTSFDKEYARFLLVFAVPYGGEDGVTSLTEALEAAHALFRDDDHEERTWEVWDAETGAFFSHVSLEDVLYELGKDDDAKR